MKHDELRRYSRQILLREVGVAGQERLRDSNVLIVGLGGLGSPVAQYVVAAGVGRVGLSEFDALEVHNLQRQTLYNTDGIGRPKLTLALETLGKLNPLVSLEPQPKLEASTIRGVIAGYDLVIDATDTFSSRYLISDACAELGKTWVWGAAVRWEGMVSVFDPRLTLRDAFPDPPEETENCDTLGVHGPLLGIVGSMMASQALKVMLGLETLRGRLWMHDALEATTRSIKLSIQPKAAV